MNCPDKDLTDGLRDMWEDLDKKERDSTKKLCPKCGSEMIEQVGGGWYCPAAFGGCRYKSWEDERGHEGKVK